MWKVIMDSAAGTSHDDSGSRCQDACIATEIPIAPHCAGSTHRALIMVCSDGAGSAAMSAEGANLTCSVLLALVAQFLQTHGLVAQITRYNIELWLAAVRTLMHENACQSHHSLEDYACTVNLVIIDNWSAVFAQLGDGAIIINDDHNHQFTSQPDTYSLVFWPDNGEYINTTCFLTADDWRHRLQYHYLDRTVEEVALMTDGLTRLALDFSRKAAHAPFFNSFFKRINSDESAESLNVLLGQFLRSKAVNDRTDDDKTLLLARREKICATTH